MRRLLPALLLSACASAPPPPGTQVEEARLLAAAVPGQATRDALRAAFGPTVVQRFDSGVEVWLYRAGLTELVVQFDRHGSVRKVRRRPPHPFDQATPAR